VEKEEKLKLKILKKTFLNNPLEKERRTIKIVDVKENIPQQPTGERRKIKIVDIKENIPKPPPLRERSKSPTS